MKTAGEILVDRLLSMNADEQKQALALLVSELTAAVLERPTGEIEPTERFDELELDSLDAVELRNKLSSETGLKLPASLVFTNKSPEAIAEYLRKEMLTGLDGGEPDA